MKNRYRLWFLLSVAFVHIALNRAAGQGPEPRIIVSEADIVRTLDSGVAPPVIELSGRVITSGSNTRRSFPLSMVQEQGEIPVSSLIRIIIHGANANRVIELDLPSAVTPAPSIDTSPTFVPSAAPIASASAQPEPSNTATIASPSIANSPTVQSVSTSAVHATTPEATTEALVVPTPLSSDMVLTSTPPEIEAAHLESKAIIIAAVITAGLGLITGIIAALIGRASKSRP
jgi:hypothetical protein